MEYVPYSGSYTVTCGTHITSCYAAKVSSSCAWFVQHMVSYEVICLRKQTQESTAQGLKPGHSKWSGRKLHRSEGTVTFSVSLLVVLSFPPCSQPPTFSPFSNLTFHGLHFQAPLLIGRECHEKETLPIFKAAWSVPLIHSCIHIQEFIENQVRHRTCVRSCVPM